MSADKIKISTIIPVYNAARYVGEAIESVLSQDFYENEIILINDGSSDNSVEVLTKYQSKARIFDRINRGPAVTLNEGINMAKGEFLTFLDADDRWLPGKLNLQLTAFQENDLLDCCFGHVQQFISPELSEEIKNKYLSQELPQPGYLRQTMMVKKRSFMKAGFFDENLRTGEFIDWYLRAKSVNLKMQMLPESVTERRIHDKSMGSNHDHDRQFASIMKQHLDRIRQNRSSAS
jgi:glycosyltransferase involved in cell wall biosynthesis